MEALQMSVNSSDTLFSKQILRNLVEGLFIIWMIKMRLERGLLSKNFP